MLTDRSTKTFTFSLTLESLLWSHIEYFANQARGRRCESLRTITTYFDTQDFDLYRGTLDMCPPKGSNKQARLRHYAESEDAPCFLEFKWHAEEVSHKRRCAFPSGRLSILDLDTFQPQDPILADVWDKVATGILSPKLVVRYARKAIEFNEHRITLDTEIRYSLPGLPMSGIYAEVGVLEIKRPVLNDRTNVTDQILRPFRDLLGGPISKCADGTRKLYSWAARAPLKPSAESKT